MPSGHVGLQRAGGGFCYELWDWTLPLLTGLLIGWLGMIFLETRLERQGRLSDIFGAPAHFSTPAAGGTDIAAFLTTNPFGVTPMKPEENVVGGEILSPSVADSSVPDTLRWTMPGTGVWMENGEGRVRPVLIGDKVGGWTLESVDYLRASFRKDEETLVRDIRFGPTLNKPLASKPTSNERAVSPGESQVIMADPVTGKEGRVSRDLLNNLLEDPIAQLREIMIRPQSDGQGLQIQHITDRSFFKGLGFKKGDVIHSINGIEIRNTTDAINFLTSLQQSDHLDIDFIRDGKPVVLRYAVD
jgi:hypothetical protein